MKIFVIVIIVFATAFIASMIGVIIRANKTDSHDDKLGEIFAGILFFSGFIGPVISGAVYCYEDKITSNYNSLVYEIYSLKSSSQIEGDGTFVFFLGYGSIKETSYYVFYSKTDKGLHLDKIETTNTYIIETDEIVPSLYRVKEKGWNDEYHIIYVPENTVRQEYEL